MSETIEGYSAEAAGIFFENERVHVACHAQVCSLWWRARFLGWDLRRFAEVAGATLDEARSWLTSEGDPRLPQLLRLQRAIGGSSPLGEILDSATDHL